MVFFITETVVAMDLLTVVSARCACFGEQLSESLGCKYGCELELDSAATPDTFQVCRSVVLRYLGFMLLPS